MHNPATHHLPDTQFIDNQYFGAIKLAPRKIGVSLGECPPAVAQRLADASRVRINGNTVSLWGAL